MNPTQHLTYISSGSFGDIYALEGTPYVLKEHVLSDDERANGKTPFCVDWHHEFELHTELYNRCAKQLGAWGVSIVKPHKFGLLIRGPSKEIRSYSATPVTATSCYYTMERVLPYNSNQPFCARTLQRILKSPNSLKYDASIPPYMYLADVTRESGHHISLPMCAGATKRSFTFKEGYDYCYVSGEALLLLDALYSTYFHIVSCGYIPRDIEFVLNARCPGNAFISVLDFNQVKSWRDRRLYSLDPNAYNLERDIAEVYIDLCGLRAPHTANPYYDTRIEPPTPQWTFLPSPLTAPRAFCDLVMKHRNLAVNYNYETVIGHILSYTLTHVLNPIKYNHQYLYLLRPSCISRAPPGSKLPAGCISLGIQTAHEFNTYLSSLAYFTRPNSTPYVDSIEQFLYYICPSQTHVDLQGDSMYLMYDLAYQNHLLVMCIQTLEARGVDVATYKGPLLDLASRPFSEILEFLVNTIMASSYKVDDVENEFFSVFSGGGTTPTKPTLLVSMARTRKLKKDNPRWPYKYYAGLSRKKATERRKEIQKYGALPSSDRRAYVGFKTDRGVKTKTSHYTADFRRLYPQAKSLAEKAKATGVPERILKASYDRGLAAWRTGHRPGATGQQWGYARVHSLLLCGKTHYGPDSDLVRDAKKSSASARRWFSRCKTAKTTLGGAKLAQGRHGAVFAPPLQCSDGGHEEFQGEGYVSKLTDNNREAQNEIRNSAMIRELDPEGTYTCPALASCAPSPEALANTNTADVVKSFGIRAPLLIYYKQCGQSIESFLDSLPFKPGQATRIPAILRALLALTREFILPTLHGNKYVHGDLHTGNIVFNEVDGRARLIDFDWLISPERRATYPERIDQVDFGFLMAAMISLVESYFLFTVADEEARWERLAPIDDLYYNYGPTPDQRRLLPSRRDEGYTRADFEDDMTALERLVGEL